MRYKVIPSSSLLDAWDVVDLRIWNEPVVLGQVCKLNETYTAHPAQSCYPVQEFRTQIQAELYLLGCP